MCLKFLPFSEKLSRGLHYQVNNIQQILKMKWTKILQNKNLFLKCNDKSNSRKFFIHQFFYKNQHTFQKGYIKNRNVLNAFKKAFLVLKFNFLFPQSLDILKEWNEKASLRSKMFLNEKIKPFLGLILLLNK